MSLYNDVGKGKMRAHSADPSSSGALKKARLTPASSPRTDNIDIVIKKT